MSVTPPRRVFVLGHRGMLGSVVARVLRARRHDVRTTNLRYSGGDNDPFVADVCAAEPEAVVNCLGVVTKSQASDSALLVANALMPQHLAAMLSGVRLIHASTDCVFDGKRGWYRVDEHPNARDPYGLSKRLGEACVRDRAIVLRTSIVGPPAAAARGLLGWFLSQGEPVEGWVDHRWNGITTLAWAELAADIIDGSVTLSDGIHQPTTDATLTKAQLLRLFADAYGHHIPIHDTPTSSACDRTLVPTIHMPPFDEQLRKLRAWEASAAG